MKVIYGSSRRRHQVGACTEVTSCRIPDVLEEDAPRCVLNISSQVLERGGTALLPWLMDGESAVRRAQTSNMRSPAIVSH